MKKLLLQFPTFSFFILTLLWSNLVWLVVLPFFHLSLDSNWFWLGESAPGLSAIFLTFITKNSKGVSQLIKPITYWQANIFYYYLVIVLMAFFYLAAIGMTALQGQLIPSFINLYSKIYFSFLDLKFFGIWMLPILTLLYFFCEELGWRGYALPKLMQRYDAFTASILIGVAWSLFHIPLMHTTLLLAHPVSFIFYIAYTIMDSIFFSWLYLNTNRSLLLVSMAHALIDIYGAFTPTIISTLGQGESESIILLRFLAFLPIFILLFKQRFSFKEKIA